MKLTALLLLLVPVAAFSQVNAPVNTPVPAFMLPAGSSASKAGSVVTITDKSGAKTFCTQVGAVMSCQTATGVVRCSSVNGNVSCR